MKGSEMERVSFAKHKGRDILIVDLSESKNADDNIAVLDKARAVIDIQAPKSLLILTNVTNAHYDPRAADAMKKYSAANTPYIKASAVVGVTGIRRVIYQAIVKITGRQISTFESADEALDWLASQP